MEPGKREKKAQFTIKCLYFASVIPHSDFGVRFIHKL